MLLRYYIILPGLLSTNILQSFNVQIAIVYTYTYAYADSSSKSPSLYFVKHESMESMTTIIQMSFHDRGKYQVLDHSCIK